MADVLINETSMTAIASAIRSKLGVQTTYKPSEMAHAISTISGSGGITPTGTKNINQNGTYDVTSYASANVNVPTGGGSPTIESLAVTANGTYTAPSGVDGYSPVTVNVPSGGATLQAKTNISPTTSSQTITPDSGFDGLSSVQINAMPTQTLPSSTSSSATGTQKAVINKSTSSQYLNIPTGYNSTAQYYNILPMDLQSLSVTENGTYSASTYDLDGFSSVTVNVSGGGGGGGIAGETGTYTVSDATTRAITITHSLGSKPKLFYMVCRDLSTIPSSQVQVAAFGIYLGSDYNVFVTSSAKKTIGVADSQVSQKSDGDFLRENVGSAAYGITSWSNDTIYFVTTGASRYWKQGTYDYVIIA